MPTSAVQAGTDMLQPLHLCAESLEYFIKTELDASIVTRSEV